MNSTPRLSLEGVTCASLIAAAGRIARAVPSWKKGRVFRHAVPQARQKLATSTYVGNSVEGDDYWVARVNNFLELDAAGRRAAFENLMQYSIGSVSDIAHCHTEYERHYIDDLALSILTPVALDAAPADYSCFSYIAQLHYNLQWPLSPRRFCNLVLVARHTLGHSAYVISVAITPTVAGAQPVSAVEAQYSAVEYVEYDPDADKLLWTMATCSDAKGLVPQWLAKLSMNSVVAQDVEHFFTWVDKK